MGTDADAYLGEQEYGGAAHTAGTSADQYLGFVGIPKPPVSNSSCLPVQKLCSSQSSFR